MSTGLDINETDDGLIVYQESTDRVHHLNPTAAVVLELCDGTRSADDIARLVAETFGLAEVPEVETKACLEDLARETSSTEAPVARGGVEELPHALGHHRSSVVAAHEL